MPRNWYVKDCGCNYDIEKGTIKVHYFRRKATECEKWVKALLNVLPKIPTKNIVICVKHWLAKYKKYKKKVHQAPEHPTSFFSNPKFFVRHSLDHILKKPWKKARG